MLIMPAIAVRPSLRQTDPQTFLYKANIIYNPTDTARLAILYKVLQNILLNITGMSYNVIKTKA